MSQNNNNDQQSAYSSAEAADLVRQGEIDASIEGMLSPDTTTSDVLQAFERAGLADESPLFDMLSRREKTESMRQARAEGDINTLNASTGLTSSKSSLSGMRTIEALESLYLDYPTMQMYVYGPLPPEGPVGVGKTDFAYLMTEIAKRAYPGISVATNVGSDEFTTIKKWSETEEWLRNEDGKKLFILDEAAQVLQFNDMNEGKVLSKLLKLIRKYQGNIILIGHTGRDVPRDVRRQLLVCRKKSKTEAEIGVGLDEQNEEIRVGSTRIEITDIPPTNVTYDTYDEADFVFDSVDTPDDEQETDDETVLCQAETNDGGSCPHDAVYPSDDPVVCQAHRHRVDSVSAD